MMASGALASVRRELRDERLPEMCLFVAVVCLVATMLIQAPLAEMDAGVGRYLVRSWDLVSLAIAGLGAWWLVQTDVTLVELRASLTREYLLFASWVLSLCFMGADLRQFPGAHLGDFRLGWVIGLAREGSAACRRAGSSDHREPYR
jgi:hypothetical protein